MATGKNYKDATLAVTSTYGAVFIPANAERKALTIWNTSANDVKFSVSAVEEDLITLVAGQHLAWLEGVPQNKINFKADVASNVVYWEA